jgi:phosphate:Na+ symporter
VQSSSATTVMIVSFVNAGLIRLRQSIGLIMGANLGTTTTFWIISYLGFKFSLSSISQPAIGIGFILLFTRSEKRRDLGELLIGFGLLFMGLNLLKAAVPDVDNNPEAFAFAQQISGYGFRSVLMFFVFGVFLTIMVQSSSVAGAVTLALAANGWIDFPSAAAIVLGENVGTTVTAIIASLTANIYARRAAAAHLIFNITGVIWMLVLFYPFIRLVDYMMPGEAYDQLYIPEHLALFHTLFNFCNICLLIGFVPKLALIVEKLLPLKPETEYKGAIAYITNPIFHTGELNIQEASYEVSRMAELSESMFRGFLEVYDKPDEDMSEKVKELKKLEEISDQIDEDLTAYLVRCSSDQLSAQSTLRVTSMMRIVTELEDICDCNYRLVLLAVRKYRNKRRLPSKTQEEIRMYSDEVLRFIQFYREKLHSPLSDDDLKTASKMEKSIAHSLNKLREQAVDRIQATGEVKSEMLYVDILSHFDKIGNHAFNIFEALQVTKKAEA